MIFLVFPAAVVLLIVIILLDILRTKGFFHKLVVNLFLIVVPHISLIIYFLLRYVSKHGNSFFLKFLIIPAGVLFAVYVCIKVNAAPYSSKQIEGFRIRVLMGGRRLILYSLYSTLVQVLIYIFAGHALLHNPPLYVFIMDITVVALFASILYINGMLRILFASKRLNIIKKIIFASTMFIPFVNIFGIIYACSVTKSEFEHECYRVLDQRMRIESAVCRTKYPIVLIHGVGFKDLKYINYWGRIPKELIKHGATVYYGNQEAWGSVEYNAQDVRNKILDIINTTGCEKVNIIAHSKGGLDARYMISRLDMGDCVASLTTICTPHRGSKVMDVLYRMPKKLFQFIGRNFDRYYRRIGDKNPDFFTACRQLSTYYSREFNETVPNDERVYYQSYAAVMKHLFSDYVLTVPYGILKAVGGDNDGLVEIESAKWGDFKGVIRNSYGRGVSHGDIIDLRRSDYKGFDVRHHYVEMVSELKAMGY